ncbi:hypothetical protein PHET_07066 [Paragonimus heterotremus]|uniref:Calponin-homology (CH) domain-containing protein n=1 Tax=Paragonimus heterotremus TaxID=100268 RepID=A0A8J4SN59_9TREM|nr:hypothetical protein PHET_07066 [Paragonimus heterotremus]
MGVETVENISDGLVIAKVLYAISPDHFPVHWLGRLNHEPNLDSRAKVHNLQIVLDAVADFLTKIPDEHIVVQPVPDLELIAEKNDEDAAFRLLQLVLGCAVNCESKQTYIEAIMCMEESVQHVLMETIQQLLTADDEYKRLITQNELLSQKCHEFELRLSVVSGEKAALQSELERLRFGQTAHPTISSDGIVRGDDNLVPSAELISPGSRSAMSPVVASVRISQLQDQLTKLRNELYQTETSKEELRLKLADALINIQDLKQKCELLSKSADESIHLKDELDIAREELAVAAHLSATVEQLRKRADEAVELRARCAQLEADNVVCFDRIAELEQEARLCGNIRSQAETQRMQAATARNEVNEVIRRAELAESELAKVREELSSTSREKLRLIAELNSLRSCCEQLQLSVLSSRDGVSFQEDAIRLRSDAEFQITPAIETQMLNLREELSRLQTSLSSLEMTSMNSVESDQAITEGVSACVEPAPTTSQPAITNFQPGCHSVSPQSITKFPSDTSLHSKCEDEQQQFSETLLQSTRAQLAQKETEFYNMEQKYRAYLWKAREVIRFLHSQKRKQDLIPDGSNDALNVDPESSEVARLRTLLVEKEAIIEKLEKHHDQTRLHRDAEERIVLAAWYNLAMERAREALEDRIRDNAELPHQHKTSHKGKHLIEHPPSARPNTSFLEQQRERHLKPPRGQTSVVMASK